jgi:hypothetical protein
MLAVAIGFGLVILLSFTPDHPGTVTWRELLARLSRYGWRLLAIPAVLLGAGLLAAGAGMLSELGLAAHAGTWLARALAGFSAAAWLVLEAINAHIRRLSTGHPPSLPYEMPAGAA